MVSRFIKSTLAEDDFEAISEELMAAFFLCGRKAQRLIGRKTIKVPELLLLEALESVDGNNTYTDTSTAQWRVFMSLRRSR